MPSPKTLLRVAVAAVAVPGALVAVSAPAASAAELAPTASAVDSQMADAQHTDVADIESGSMKTPSADDLELPGNDSSVAGHDLNLNLPAS